MKDNPIIIAGSARSGTTWVLDVIAKSNNLRTVFEPLQPYGVPEARYMAHRYLKSNSSEPEIKSFMEKVFKGNLQYIWPNTRFLPCTLQPKFSHMSSLKYDYIFISRYKHFLICYFNYLNKFSCRRITKFIRANLMLDWLIANFNATIIFIVRHPGAVVASKLSATKTNPTWDFYGIDQQNILSQYKCDELLRKDYLEEYHDIFSKKLSPAEGHTVLWCIENILPIYRQQKKKYYVFFYEDIVTNPVREFDRMIKILGLEKKPNNSVIMRPSQQASREFRKNSFEENQLTRWMKGFSYQQLSEIDEVLKYFKVTTYNAFEPMPVNKTQDFI